METNSCTYGGVYYQHTAFLIMQSSP